MAHDAWTPTGGPRSPRPGSGSRADPTRRVGSLSGGQRTRLALATIMTTRPACLLLDELTNHLDDEAIEVLTEFLRTLPGVVLLASHDRVLLDDVATDLVDLDPSAFGTDGSGDGSSGAAGRPTPLTGQRPGAGGRRPSPRSGAARRAPGRDPHRRLGHRAQPPAARQRPVHLRLQGRQGPAHPGPAKA
ncbi:ATP-binding cassette domain-containing protein [Nocardioides sp.]|uniref:ATP-binding cassette domain-containing protein n=1 Tax=Nocardioides sp. TaxID=35761 RepID=UPI00352853FC